MQRYLIVSRGFYEQVHILVRSLWAAWRRAWVLLSVLLLTGIAAARIVSTYSVFSQTWDEGPHIAAGMEWLDHGTYSYPEHPPLARVAVAVGPFLDGLRHPGHEDMWKEGNQILHARGRYSRNLALARLGVLPFFLLATWIVWAWSQMLFGDITALLAVLLFTSLPPVLAHAGLATTDMPLTGVFLWALLVFIFWVQRPSFIRSLVLGFAGALAILTKFSALIFLPSCGLAILALPWVAGRGMVKAREAGGRGRLIAIGLTTLTALLIVWAGYRFSVRPLTTATERPHETIDHFVGPDGSLHDLTYSVAESVLIPAPELFLGINQVRHLNAEGKSSYLLGEIRDSGWWYFFPIALAVKSPLPFLILTGIGLALLSRQAWLHRLWLPLVPAAAAIALLLVCLPSRINIGLRHILPIYPLLAIVAGFGAATLWNLGRSRWVGPSLVIGLLAWQLGASAHVHPDYLAYFNELAGRHPNRILMDSDLDWGQDLLRLADILRTQGVDSVTIAYNGSADLNRHNLPPFRLLLPHQTTTGWIAISEYKLKLEGYAWLEVYEPVALVGRSIRLYHLPHGLRTSI